MKTLDIMFTRGDAATQPGGIILRQKPDGEYVTHCFNRLAHTRDPKEFFWGHYFLDEAAARADFAKRVSDNRQPTITEGEIIAKGDAGFDISGNWETIDA